MCPGVSGGTPYLLPAPWAHGPLAGIWFLGATWSSLGRLGRAFGSPWVAWGAFLADFLPTENSSKIRLLKKPPKIEKIEPWTPKCRFFTLRACPPTQLILSGKGRSVTKLSRRPYVASTRCRSLWGDPGGEGGGKGNQGDPQGPKGNPRAPSAPLGGWAHGALWGYSEAIPNGKPFRVEP